MGYGLRSDVPALVNRDRQFDIVPDHYRAFSLEPGPNSSMDLNVYVPSENARFGTFLELIQQLNMFANQETVLVVNHGMSDQNDDPLGLILPLTSGSAWNPEEYSLGVLAGFVGKTPSDAEYADKEKNSSMETAQHQKIPIIRPGRWSSAATTSTPSGLSTNLCVRATTTRRAPPEEMHASPHFRSPAWT